MPLSFFCLPRKHFRSYLMIFKCPFAIWLRSFTVDISYVSRTGAVVSLSTWNLETVWHFLESTVAKSLDKVNISEKNFLPINPLGPIVHGLYFSNDNIFSVRCIPGLSTPHVFKNDVIKTTAHDIICECKWNVTQHQAENAFSSSNWTSRSFFVALVPKIFLQGCKKKIIYFFTASENWD